MIEEIEYKGIWWLPDNPQKRISGTLRFAPGKGAILDLTGSFKDIKDMNKLFKPEIILGTSAEGKNITLYKCIEVKSTLSIPGLLTSSFDATVVFVGAHFQRGEEIKFKRLSIHYSYLDEWVNISGFDISQGEEEISIKYKLPQPIQTVIGDYKISIDFKRIGPKQSIVQKEASVKQRAYITIEPLQEKPFEEYDKINYHIQNFLSLGITKPVYPLAIEGMTEVNKQIIGDKPYYPPVQIFYKLPGIPESSKTLLPYNMLFTFKDISNRFEAFLRNWFEKRSLLKPVYDLYFGTLYNPRMYLEHRFLSLIQGIESFHQRTHRGEYLSDKDYKDVYDALVNAIPDKVKKDFRDSLKDKLKYANKFSLRKRLKDIFDEYQEILDEFIENTNGFINKVVVTRNYLVHYDQELEGKAAKGEELYRLTQKLGVVLETCLLAELGFNLNEIKDLFSKNRRYELHA